MPSLMDRAKELLKDVYEKRGCVRLRASNKSVELRLVVNSGQEVEHVQAALARIEVLHGLTYWKRSSGTSRDRVIPVYRRGSVERFFQIVKPNGFERILRSLKQNEPPRKKRGQP